LLRRKAFSQEADKDLEDIFDYTVDKFGLEQAVAYVIGFE
jgi:toxin ParE1/3/4